VREPEKHFDVGRDDTSNEVPKNLRKLPFAAVKVTTLVTPSLDVLSDKFSFIPKVGGTLNSTGDAFTGGTLFRFGFEAMDVEGNIIHFSAPVVWIPAGDRISGVDLPKAPDLSSGQSLYDGDLTDDDKKCPLAGQRFAYA